MSDNRYTIYLDDTKKLAATLIIKSSITPVLQNKRLITLYGANAAPENHPEQWCYYLNLSGNYHSTNKLMTVTSLDTLEEIVFNKNNLLVHRATAKAYQFGTRYYNELVSRFPDQETLILGILHPVDLQTAIDAADGAILGYPSELVEYQEYTLIARLQRWINAYRLRYVNEDFNYSDNLYSTTEHSVMYVQLVLAIIGIRFEMCHTNEAHSFHVRQYLASNYSLDRYMDYMTLEQRLFLYKNLRYIQRHVGSNETHDWLVEKFLTARKIPLAEYTVRHVVSGMPDSLLPSVMVRRTPVNLKDIYTDSEMFTLEEYFEKIKEEAPGNLAYRDVMLPKAEIQMARSLSAIVNTKTFESSMIDYSDSDRYQLPDVLLAHWMYHSQNGMYESVINSENPQTGEIISLPAKDAFVFMVYLYSLWVGLPLQKVPTLLARNVLKPRLPTVTEMLGFVEKRFWPKAAGKLQSCIDAVPGVVRQISTAGFYDQVYGICNAMNKQIRLIANEYQFQFRTQLTMAVTKCYHNVTIAPEDPDMSMETWLAMKGLDVSALTNAQLGILFQNIFNAGTGMDTVKTTSLADIQSAMLGVLRTLSSYSVQYIASINQQTLINLGDPYVLVGDQSGAGSAHKEVYQYPEHINRVGISITTDAEFSAFDDGHELDISTSIHNQATIDIRVPVHAPPMYFTPCFRIGKGIRPTVIFKDADVPNGMTAVPGSDILMAMAPEDRNKLVDAQGGGYLS